MSFLSIKNRVFYVISILTSIIKSFIFLPQAQPAQIKIQARCLFVLKSARIKQMRVQYNIKKQLLQVMATACKNVAVGGKPATTCVPRRQAICRKSSDLVKTV